ncbi:MAG: glycosyltransferase family 9 protein [Bacteroidota bacterium]
MTIIISRTDAIGDVVLTLPLAGIIKSNFPECKILFLGKTYTQPVIALSKYVNGFINYDDFIKLNEKDRADFLRSFNATDILHVFPRKEIAYAAKKAGIKNRTGTSHRLYHWFTCNKLISFSRKNSDLHEAQLNCMLLKSLQLKVDYSKAELISFYGMNCSYSLPQQVTDLLNSNKLNVIIHPRSHGSAREWGLSNYKDLIYMLHAAGVNCLITGSPVEQEELKEWMKTLPEGVNDLTGKLQLKELIALLNVADGIVAGSTGPLHIAAALGKNTLGFYPPIRPMHAGRWAPLGLKAGYVTFDKDCNDCKKNPEGCTCIKNISTKHAAELILKWKK